MTSSERSRREDVIAKRVVDRFRRGIDARNREKGSISSNSDKDELSVYAQAIAVPVNLSHGKWDIVMRVVKKGRKSANHRRSATKEVLQKLFRRRLIDTIQI